MIWRLIGLNAAGDEVAVADLSATLLQAGQQMIILCPLSTPMTDAEAAAAREALERAGIPALVFSQPVQVWKVGTPEDTV